MQRQPHVQQHHVPHHRHPCQRASIEVNCGFIHRLGHVQAVAVVGRQRPLPKYTGDALVPRLPTPTQHCRLQIEQIVFVFLVAQALTLVSPACAACASHRPAPLRPFLPLATLDLLLQALHLLLQPHDGHVPVVQLLPGIVQLPLEVPMCSWGGLWWHVGHVLRRLLRSHLALQLLVGFLQL